MLSLFPKFCYESRAVVHGVWSNCSVLSHMKINVDTLIDCAGATVLATFDHNRLLNLEAMRDYSK